MVRHVWIGVTVATAIATFSVSASEMPAPPVKQASALYGVDVVRRVRANVAKDPWAAGVREAIIDAAAPWRAMDDDELWAMVFGATLPRSWMVWSDGDCPACGKSVVMYNWRCDAIRKPWKFECPHCREVFPKNDFAAFYRSGLNQQGVFDPSLADRSLLFNVEHPDPNDPKHHFGVDDGQGYIEGAKRWRFIGAYLIYGQWKQAIVGGISKLAGAYLVTGDPVYARKAGILLDRVADLYPTFDFKSQGWVYETQGNTAGYVSVWHDACEETRELVMAYDMVFEGLRDDELLVRFLSEKARACGLANPKASVADIQRNIEQGLLRDPLIQRAKITSNYPRTELAVCMIHSVLGGAENEAAFDKTLEAALARGTAVDGVTGEKGLAGYCAFDIQGLANFLAEYEKAQPGFLKRWIARQPRLRETYRFHIDTHCLKRYYPTSGDAGYFAAPTSGYAGMVLLQPARREMANINWTCVPPSAFSLLWELYRCTGDAAYVQTLVHLNSGRVDGLPRDLYAEDPAAIRQAMRTVIDREGPTIPLGGVNKQQWCLAILRSGRDADARAVWLDYDSGGNHSHRDCMNLGLYAKGLDLMPDFGYPPVQFGGWGSPRAQWYVSTAAHNTVVVDGQSMIGEPGRTELWMDGAHVRAIRASAPKMQHASRYERTTVLVDVSPADAYMVDVFRVAGGAEHTNFMHSHYGRVAPTGLALAPAPDYGRGTFMRNTRMDPAPKPGWHVDWNIEDRYALLPKGVQVRLRYTGLTPDVQVALTEGWIVAGLYESTAEAWIPRLFVRRQAAEGEALASTFVAVIEPYETQPLAASIRRLPLESTEGAALIDSHVAMAITLADGRRDIVIVRDPTPAGVPAEVVQPESGVRTDAELCVVRQGDDGRVVHVAAARGSHVVCGGFDLTIPADADSAEWPSTAPTSKRGASGDD
ncbi:MAG: heparinase II/III family protein [Phycisphaerae bacterium]|nr:heparinase II/III family protein [Phycisphaerae bacterium]